MYACKAGMVSGKDAMRYSATMAYMTAGVKHQAQEESLLIQLKKS